MNARSEWNWRAALALILAAGVAASAVAQATATEEEKKDEALKLEKFVVTGSLIPVAADSPAVPVTVISSLAIEQSGVNTDLLQVLKKTEPYFYGANNVGSDNGNISSGSTNGGSQVALRNRATLVLINGRRANVNPVTASGGNNFVDVSMIPIAAVERIEVLSDGASATYGSDAVSGVVNVILKTNYNGVEIGGRYGWSPNQGKYREKSYYVVAGTSNDKTSITLSSEWKKSDPLIQYERPYGVGQFRTPSYAGVVNIGNDWYYLNPSLNAPPLNQDLTPAQLVANGTYSGPMDQTAASQFFDLAAKPTMLLKAERRSVVGAIDHQLTDTVRLFGDFIYSATETQSVLNAQPVSGNVAAGTASNPFERTVTARNRFVNYPRIYNTTATTTRGVVGIKGTVGNTAWSYELAGDFNRTVTNFRNENLIDAAAYTAAVTNGTYNPFARTQAPGVIQGMLGTSTRDFVSELNGFDLRVAGEVMDLPAGPLQVGFGAETRWESLDFTNDRYDQTGGWLQATPRQPFRARSTTDGFFAETRVPVFDKSNSIPGFHQLELSLAARKDIYSSTTDPFVPKYTMKWLPFNDELALRGTYSESFSAPTLFQLFGPISQGFTASINITRYSTSGTSLGIASGSRQYRSRSGSNPNLKPSESRNWTAGVVWSPKKIKGLEVSLDWFNIDERDLVSTISSTLIVTSVEQLGPASPYASLVKFGTSLSGESHFDDGSPVTSPGQMTNQPSDGIWISNAQTNVAGVWQSGLDAKIGYTYDTKSWGVLRGTVSATYLHEYVIQSLPSDTPYDYADTFSGTSVYPRIRTYTSLNWNFKSMSAGLSHTYIPPITDVAWATEYEVKGYHNFDLYAGYSFSGSDNKWLDGFSLNVGVNNVFNKYPPLIRSEGNQSHDINTYDPIGRFVYFSGKYKF